MGQSVGRDCSNAVPGLRRPSKRHAKAMSEIDQQEVVQGGVRDQGVNRVVLRELDGERDGGLSDG